MEFNGETKLFHYPERTREALLASSGLTYGDGSTVSPEEIWEFMTVSGPLRFPYLFTLDRFTGGLSPDVDFLPGLKRHYWLFNSFDRSQQRRAQGVPVAVIQAGGPLEIHYAAQCMIERPGYPLNWMLAQQEKLTREAMLRRMSALRDEYSKSVPAECCSIVAPFCAVHEAGCPVDFLAPVAMTACSDALFAMEATRRRDGNFPAFIVDFPVNQQAGEWRVEYLAEQFRTLAQRLGELSGVTVDGETLRAEIHRQNQLRRLARECTEIWWNAEVPPTNSGDSFFFNTADQYDFPVLLQILQETKAELQRRSAQRILGAGLQPDPLRLFVCGSCAMLNAYLVEQVGGVIAGQEQLLSFSYNEVSEQGDPFVSLAESTCAMPYDLPPAQRAAWTAEKVRQSRADGVVFIYNWGCSYQSDVARAVCEIIRQQTGVPTLVMDINPMGHMTTDEQMRTRLEAFFEILRHHRRVPPASAFETGEAKL